jgi:hypothetical protein
MSGEDIIHQRGAALESQFFAEVDAKLMADLQAELKKSDDAKGLAKLSGIDDPAVLNALVAAGVSPSTFPALRLFPLVAMAWADGMLEKSERETVLAAAYKHSVGAESPSGAILAAWLDKEPGPKLFEAWEAFAKSLAAHLNASDAKSVRESIMKEVVDVAQASGGLLGWGAISRGESELANRIERALTR